MAAGALLFQRFMVGSSSYAHCYQKHILGEFITPRYSVGLYVVDTGPGSGLSTARGGRNDDLVRLLLNILGKFVPYTLSRFGRFPFIILHKYIHFVIFK